MEDLILQGEWFTWRGMTIRAICPAREFVSGFDTRAQSDLHIAARIAETSFRTGRSPGGRLERVEGSSTGLYELKVTPPGRRGPHTRLFFVVADRIAWVSSGIVKTRRKLSRSDIAYADKIVQEWRREQGR